MNAESMSLPDPKIALRKTARLRLNALSGEERAAASRSACALLKARRIWGEAECILFYAPTAVELDIWPLLQEALALGKVTLLPRFNAVSLAYEACRISTLETDIVAAKFGIREGAKHCPTLPLNRLDLALVPGLAFDPHGRRLGRGKGFYDRLLSAVRGVKCGVAFEQQLLAEVPVEPHDILLNCILTPTRWIEL